MLGVNRPVYQLQQSEQEEWDQATRVTKVCGLNARSSADAGVTRRLPCLVVTGTRWPSDPAASPLHFHARRLQNVGAIQLGGDCNP